MSGLPRVFFYVQHLLGIGHLKRAATLARAMAHEGLSVTVVSGGEPVPVLDASGMELVQLPPVRASDRTFQGLVDHEGEPAQPELLAARRDTLLAAFDRVRPEVLMIELFPFGRRQLRGEIVPLIEAARALSPRPRIVSSVRDILVEKNRPERDAEMVATARRLFDDVLVHGDPNLIAFDATFARAREIADMLHYTGYVVEHEAVARANGAQGTGEVIVSSGSGAVGELLLRTALAARPETSLAAAPWRLLAGYSLSEQVFDELQRAAPPGVVVERARADFVTLLKNCALSVSQGGYNTVMEILATGARAVVVPYAGGQETEQTLRARLLAERGLIRQVPEGDLTPQILARLIDAARAQPATDALSIDLGGAAETGRIVASWARQLRT